MTANSEIVFTANNLVPNQVVRLTAHLTHPDGTGRTTGTGEYTADKNGDVKVKIASHSLTQGKAGTLSAFFHETDADTTVPMLDKNGSEVKLLTPIQVP